MSSKKLPLSTRRCNCSRMLAIECLEVRSLLALMANVELTTFGSMFTYGSQGAWHPIEISDSVSFELKSDGQYFHEFRWGEGILDSATLRVNAFFESRNTLRIIPRWSNSNQFFDATQGIELTVTLKDDDLLPNSNLAVTGVVYDRLAYYRDGGFDPTNVTSDYSVRWAQEAPILGSAQSIGVFDLVGDFPIAVLSEQPLIGDTETYNLTVENNFHVRPHTEYVSYQSYEDNQRVDISVLADECSVPPLSTSHDNLPADDVNNIIPELQQAVADFRTSVLNALPGAFFQVTDGHRSVERQTHFYEIKSKFNDLKALDGIEAYKTTVGSNPKLRPQLKLRTSPPPSDAAQACKHRLNDINQEIAPTHLLKPTGNGSGVSVAVSNPAENSHHILQPAEAVDIALDNRLSFTQIEQLANAAGLYRPFPQDDVHFELLNSASNIQTTIIGNSPINLLVEDSVGKRIGYDSTSQITVNDFGSSGYYSGPGSEPQIIRLLLGNLFPGALKVSGVGTGVGSYSVSVQVSNEDGVEVYSKIVSSGIAATGQPIQPMRPFNPHIAASKVWTNPFDKLDVNDNFAVTPLDALLVINQLNRIGSRKLYQTGNEGAIFLDVSDDGFLSPIDALLVINKLNARSREGEGESDSLKQPWREGEEFVGDYWADDELTEDIRQARGIARANSYLRVGKSLTRGGR